MLTPLLELQTMGLILSCLVITNVGVSEFPEIPEGQEPISIANPLFENYTIGEEHFFRSTEEDGNGSGWDNRLGK